MPVLVVVAFQIVHVDHQHGEPLTESGRALHFAPERHFQESVVVDLGQVVGHRQLFRAPIELPVLDRDRGLVREERENAKMAHIERRRLDPVHRHQHAEDRVPYLEGRGQDRRRPQAR